MNTRENLIAGVDEVGRGSFFGPIFAGAVILNKSNELKLDQLPRVYLSNSSIISDSILIDYTNQIVTLLGDNKWLLKSNDILDNKNKIIFETKNLHWNIKSGEIYNEHKIRGYRKSIDRNSSFTLNGNYLKGNLKNNIVNVATCEFIRNKSHN